MSRGEKVSDLVLFLCKNDEKCEVLCGSVFVFSLFLFFLQKSSVGSVGVFLWIWSKKVVLFFKKSDFFCLGDKLGPNALTMAVSSLDLIEKWHYKRLCTV